VTQEIQEVATLLKALGDKGLTAFIVWVVLDLSKTIIIWGSSVFVLLFLISRIGQGIRDGIASVKKES